jgi:hypothetical protein
MAVRYELVPKYPPAVYINRDTDVRGEYITNKLIRVSDPLLVLEGATFYKSVFVKADLGLLTLGGAVNVQPRYVDRLPDTEVTLNRFYFDEGTVLIDYDSLLGNGKFLFHPDNDVTYMYMFGESMRGRDPQSFKLDSSELTQWHSEGSETVYLRNVEEDCTYHSIEVRENLNKGCLRVYGSGEMSWNLLWNIEPFSFKHDTELTIFANSDLLFEHILPTDNDALISVVSSVLVNIFNKVCPQDLANALVPHAKTLAETLLCWGAEDFFNGAYHLTDELNDKIRMLLGDDEELHDMYESVDRKIAEEIEYLDRGDIIEKALKIEFDDFTQFVRSVYQDTCLAVEVRINPCYGPDFDFILLLPNSELTPT